MPELPEVQTTVDGINRKVKGLAIKDVWTSYNSSYHSGKDNIKDPKFFSKFKKDVIGKKIIVAKRRAKNILIDLSNKKTILVHMKMTGHIMYGNYIFDEKNKRDPWIGVDEALKDPFNRHIRLVFSLSNKRYLALSDIRRFAKVTILDTEKLDHSPHLSHLGLEPLDESFGAKAFYETLLKRPNAKIKQALMDQTLVVGIGNIYSDEALWQSGIHPESRVKDIPKEKMNELFRAVRNVLKKGVDFGGDSMSDYRNIDGLKGKFQEKHNAYRKTGKKCGKTSCGGIIEKKKIGGRSAHFCNIHQKKFTQ